MKKGDSTKAEKTTRADDEQNLVALIVGEQMFLNADFIESIHGRYNQTTEEKSDDGDGDDLEAA